MPAPFGLEVLFNFIQHNWQAYLHSAFMQDAVKSVSEIMAGLGIDPPYPNAAELTLTFLAPIATLGWYFLFFGDRHRKRRNNLARNLSEAQLKVLELEEALERLEEEEQVTRHSGKEVRVFMDGAFDVMHYGHMNAFRQGRAHGTYLVVGINSDASITECKGTPPIMNDAERTAAVAGCKFVDEVVPNCPYVMNEEYLNWIIKTYKIDYVVHGDDPCIVDGKDVYETAKKAGKYRSIPRTEGVSTTDIVGRMLLMTKHHHSKLEVAEEGSAGSLASAGGPLVPRRSRFLATSRILRLFSQRVRSPKPSDRVVYMAGSWDMFHAGHVEVLKRAKALGDYLIVGVLGDERVNLDRGSNFPIMNLNERVLSVLGNKYVDDVLIDCPWEITKEMIASMNVQIVARGDPGRPNLMPTVTDARPGSKLRMYSVPDELGITRIIPDVACLSVYDIISRIKTNEERLMAKFVKKNKAEEEFWQGKHDENKK